VDTCLRGGSLDGVCLAPACFSFHAHNLFKLGLLLVERVIQNALSLLHCLFELLQLLLHVRFQGLLLRASYHASSFSQKGVTCGLVFAGRVSTGVLLLWVEVAHIRNAQHHLVLFLLQQNQLFLSPLAFLQLL
jgi:hypothetical protein